MDRATLRQALVQCLLQRRMTKRADAYAAYQRLATHMGVDEAFDADLDAIHASLAPLGWDVRACHDLSLIHISEPTRLSLVSRMPSSA